MPIKVHREESTGIYQRVRVRASGSDIQTAMAAAFDEHNYRPAHWLDMVEEAAALTLNADHASPNIKDEQIRAEFMRGVKEAAGDCRILRYALESGDCESAVYCAYMLGRRVEQCSVRSAEPHAALGIRTRSAQRRRHEKAHGTRADKEERWHGYQKKIDNLRAKDRALSYNRACDIVATECGAHINTVKNHTINRKYSN